MRNPLAIGAVLLCMSAFGLARQTSPSELAGRLGDGAAGMVGQEGWLKLDVVVGDTSGKPVSHLEAKDFKLLDNGEEKKILSFQAFDEGPAKADPAVEVILVIDTVNLPASQVPDAESAVESFLRSNHGHLAQPVSIFLLAPAGLSSTGQPSNDGNVLAEEIARDHALPVVQQTAEFHVDQLARTGTMAPMDVANRNSLRTLGAIAIEERRYPGRKLLFWIGPGWPVDVGAGENSFDTVTELSTRLREARIAIWSATAWPHADHHFAYQDYLEPVRSAKNVRFGHLALEVLATQSGGGVIHAGSNLAGWIEACVEQSSVYYRLTFDPSRTGEVDAYHDVKVGVDKPNTKPRTNSGYYDEPVYLDEPSQARRVTVEQLEQVLGSAGGSSDKEVAQELAQVELSERMSSRRLLAWKARLPGERSRAGLVALADKSAFLALAASDILSTAPPDQVSRRQMLSQTLTYLSRTMLKLPDFIATRTTIQYDEPPQKDEGMWKVVTRDQSLHATGTFKTTVVFRDGKEVVDAGARQGKTLNARERRLDTQGAFGPILAMVFEGAAGAGSEFSWDHWEQGADGPEAVFRYTVPRDRSRFEAGFCCLADPDGTIMFERKVGYRGEVATDPRTGAILRLTVDASLEPRLPMASSGIMVEYSSVVIGGQTYICPVRSVSISRQRTVKVVKEWGESFGVYGRFETILSDVNFADYHVFRAASRILTEERPAPH